MVLELIDLIHSHVAATVAVVAAAAVVDDDGVHVELYGLSSE
jgi:hypothetical protein